MCTVNSMDNLVDSFYGRLHKSIDLGARDVAEVDRPAYTMGNMVRLAQPLVRFEKSTAPVSELMIPVSERASRTFPWEWSHYDSLRIMSV